MANICCDTVVFYPEHEADLSSLHKFGNDLETCYPEHTASSDSWIGILLEYLHISTDGLYVRGDVICTDIQKDYIVLDLDAAWHPLFEVYQALAQYYNLSFVMQSEEPGSNIFVNTDANGFFLNTRYRILLYLENDSAGTPYEKLFQEQTDTDFYFASEEDVLSWFSTYGIAVESLEELNDTLDTDFVQFQVYNLSYK